MTRVLLLSTYELGHQPLGLAAPAAALRAAGHEVRCLDLSVEPLDAEAVRASELIGISLPMHTAARLGLQVARAVRELAPTAHLACYGLYAAPLYDRLVGSGLADSAIGGEYELALLELADRLAAGAGDAAVADSEGALRFDRWAHPVPDRRGLPGLDQYARLDAADGLHLAGYVEASRGCAHTCTHCPITPVYGGRLRLIGREAVLADIEQQVAAGAEHITFGDPDFLNAVPHSLAILEAAHAQHPHLTFDVTIKVEHLLEHAALLPRLRELGVLFVTSAFESTNDAVLARLEKGHVAADLGRALAAAAGAGLEVRPTWVAFTPWSSLEDFVALLAFVEAHGLVRHVQAVQYALRLLLPPGSALVDALAAEDALGEFDGERLTYNWRHRDARVDALQAELAAIVEAAARRHLHDEDALEEPQRVFGLVKRAALAAVTGEDRPVEVAPQPRHTAPGLTESWFC